MRFLRRSAPSAPEPRVNRCRHITDDVEPVHDVDGRLVAALCTACDQNLPAWKACKDCGCIAVGSIGTRGSWRELMSPCSQHASWPPPNFGGSGGTFGGPHETMDA